MAKHSAGLLLYRASADGDVEVLIVHPGGPFWARRDDGAWSIPKGEHPAGADPWDAARREFVEEIGLAPPDGERTELGVVRQAGGKLVTVFAVRGELDVTDARSNTFELEWPPRSGKLCEFPEVDRVGWFPLDRARVKLLAGQRPALDWLTSHLGREP
ncbi:NTP pyrophosphohydrolase [Mycolicibacter minnesotensis]|uniref:NTP pyrophosphohydrolase n=1 Tax=Mycolicibacter minnesotensis TaxID=1118379 RepID=A0A7I7R5I3_9MYCO|nr:NUDIX domain-containing protein [Mycolicibacter minnesotensis]ORB01056.1 NTP pyrophosphohydrolase [Mycolicibacter minnesotensis]BBY33417.1 NUDIX domain-containing protein [Mycolicibacter minnesotensis]